MGGAAVHFLFVAGHVLQLSCRRCHRVLHTFCLCLYGILGLIQQFPEFCLFRRSRHCQNYDLSQSLVFPLGLGTPMRALSLCGQNSQMPGWRFHRYLHSGNSFYTVQHPKYGLIVWGSPQLVDTMPLIPRVYRSSSSCLVKLFQFVSGNLRYRQISVVLF